VLAALGLALLPEAVEAGGRARFYAPMMFWSLLAAWAFFEAIRHTGDAALPRRTVRRWHLFFGASFAFAIFSHEEIALLYPALLLAALWWRGWSYLRLPGAAPRPRHQPGRGGAALAHRTGRAARTVAGDSDQPALS
jgi:4-amino-4-deoxy-L-arabinose transferase-like glycosyltransferase